MVLTPFRIDFDDAEIADLKSRLDRTRWPDALDEVGWRYGTDPDYLHDLVDYWRTDFDWRAHEAALNSREHYLADVDGLKIHLVRAGEPGGMPLLVLHGWPGSFVQMLDLSDHLSTSAVSFDIVIASLPGFAFSEPAHRPGMSERGIATIMHDLMTVELGFTRYAVRGSDFGAGVAQELAVAHPEAVIGIHLSGTSPAPAKTPPDATPAELEYLANVHRWRAQEIGYSAISHTKPQTLATALADSPSGLASWIVEKFRRWSDCGGDVERRFTKDQLLLNITIYWLTNSVGSSIRLYRESVDDDQAFTTTPDVPTGHLMSSKDMFLTPREWVARSARVDHWTQVDTGGHFIEWEEPQLVADDLTRFFARFG